MMGIMMMTTRFENGSRIGGIAHLPYCGYDNNSKLPMSLRFQTCKNGTYGFEKGSMGRPESNNVILALAPSNVGLM